MAWNKTTELKTFFKGGGGGGSIGVGEGVKINDNS